MRQQGTAKCAMVDETNLVRTILDTLRGILRKIQMRFKGEREFPFGALVHALHQVGDIFKYVRS